MVILKYRNGQGYDILSTYSLHIIYCLSTISIHMYIVTLCNTELLCKAKIQYLLTCKVSRHCLLALHGTVCLSRNEHWVRYVALSSIVQHDVDGMTQVSEWSRANQIHVRWVNNSKRLFSCQGKTLLRFIFFWLGKWSQYCDRKNMLKLSNFLTI